MKITDLFTKVENITPSNARKMIDENKAEEIQILDVREPAEYESGHIPGAKLIPLSVLPDRLNELDSSKPAVVY